MTARSVTRLTTRRPIVAADRALRQLIERHGHAVPLGDLPWLGGILGQVRRGYPLRPDQQARVSQIRAQLARLLAVEGGIR